MPVCVPMRELKDTAKFTSLVEHADGPVTVTRNGKDALVVMTSDSFESMRQELARARLLTRIAQAERELAKKRYVDGTSFTAMMRERYAAE